MGEWGGGGLSCWLWWLLHGNHGEFPSNFSSIYAIRPSAWVALSVYFVTASVSESPSVRSSEACMAVP